MQDGSGGSFNPQEPVKNQVFCQKFNKILSHIFFVVAIKRAVTCLKTFSKTFVMGLSTTKKGWKFGKVIANDVRYAKFSPDP
jgi:hypothetical protein